MGRFTKLYYLSMLIYAFGAVFFVLYSLIVMPVAEYYHEDVAQMVSPVFGNYSAFLGHLFLASIAVVTVSLLVFAISMIFASKDRVILSRRTMLLPVIMYAVAYLLLAGSSI